MCWRGWGRGFCGFRSELCPQPILLFTSLLHSHVYEFGASSSLAICVDADRLLSNALVRSVALCSFSRCRRLDRYCAAHGRSVAVLDQTYSQRAAVPGVDLIDQCFNVAERREEAAQLLLRRQRVETRSDHLSRRPGTTRDKRVEGKWFRDIRGFAQLRLGQRAARNGGDIVAGGVASKRQAWVGRSRVVAL
jgi:hypothetical protein